MSLGTLSFEKLSGGVLTVVPSDGNTSTTLVLPESGTVIAANSSGNVGIGTGNVTAPLTLKTSSSYVSQDILGDSDLNAVSVRFRNSANTATNVFLNYDNNQFKYGTVGSEPVVINTNNIERARIDGSGNLGIGTSSPTQKISVQGNMYNAQSTSMRILDAGDFSGNKPLHHNYIETGSDHWGDNGFMAFGTQNVERMRITDSSVLFGKEVAGQNNIIITAETGAIQAYKSNITMNMPIKLNPEPTGGNALIGTATDNGMDKLQVNGSFSSGATRQIGGVDLNSFRYRTENIGVWSNVTNKPIDEYGYLEVIVYEVNAWILQRFTCLGAIDSTKAGRTFSRCYINGATWTPWVEK